MDCHVYSLLTAVFKPNCPSGALKLYSTLIYLCIKIKGTLIQPFLCLMDFLLMAYAVATDVCCVINPQFKTPHV